MLRGVWNAMMRTTNEEPGAYILRATREARASMAAVRVSTITVGVLRAVHHHETHAREFHDAEDGSRNGRSGGTQRGIAGDLNGTS